MLISHHIFKQPHNLEVKLHKTCPRSQGQSVNLRMKSTYVKMGQNYGPQYLRIEFPLPTPCLNKQCCTQQWSHVMVWINIENEEQSLIDHFD